MSKYQILVERLNNCYNAMNNAENMEIKQIWHEKIIALKNKILLLPISETE